MSATHRSKPARPGLLETPRQSGDKNGDRMGETAEHPGREVLRRWRELAPRNLYTADPQLAAAIDAWAGARASSGMQARLEAFGATAATELGAFIDDCERLDNLPVLRAWSGIGERTEEIEFHPSYAEAGRLVWASGVLACRAEPGRATEQAALFYMLAQHGEGGHCCPVACTTGMIRALQEHGSEELRNRFLPRLLDPDYERAEVAAQFFTELQGGSDVGANLVMARPEGEAWRISGEKWFCSVANADQFLVSARVEGQGPGTAGLGTFLVPRLDDGGRPNGFRIRRLKTKLGTRAMASAEIDFEDARAYAIGAPGDGFSISVDCVLNTSRWINALGSCGILRRAYVEASSFARVREAFGGSILRFPLVRETLADMRCEWLASLTSTFYLSALIDRIDTGKADPHQEAVYRFLVNANKYITSIAAAAATRMGVEVLGGNGTIEDFSVMPRLLRDNIVYESWEGTHNVLAAQVLKDAGKLGHLANIHDEINTLLSAVPDPRLAEDAGELRRVLAGLSEDMARSVSDGPFGAAHFRRQLTSLTRLFQAALMMSVARDEASSAAAAYYLRRHLLPGYRPESDGTWNDRIEALLAGELTAAA